MTPQPGSLLCSFLGILHLKSQLLKVDLSDMKRSMNQLQGTLICGDKTEFVGSKVSPLAGSPHRFSIVVQTTDEESDDKRPS